MMHLPKMFCNLSIAAVLLVDNDLNAIFLFAKKKDPLEDIRCNQSYRRRLFLQETKNYNKFLRVETPET